MSSLALNNLRKKRIGYQNRVNQLYKLYKEDGRQFALDEAKEAENRLQAFDKFIEKKKKDWNL